MNPNESDDRGSQETEEAIDASFWDSWFDELGEEAAREELETDPDPDPDPEPDLGFDEDDEEENEPVYDSLEEWVQFYFLPMFRRVEGGENKWCRQWWRHSEAIARLDAMWRSWESLRLDEQMGMSVWLRDHADHHVPLLMGQNGPFRQCAGERHREAEALQADWAPDGWWDDEDEEG